MAVELSALSLAPRNLELPESREKVAGSPQYAGVVLTTRVHADEAGTPGSLEPRVLARSVGPGGTPHATPAARRGRGRGRTSPPGTILWASALSQPHQK